MRHQLTPGTVGPLSRLVDVSNVPPHGLEVQVEATEEERDALAKDFKLSAIRSLTGDYKLTASAKGVHVAGTVRAAITQICVVSLEPFDSDLAEDVQVDFAETIGMPAEPPTEMHEYEPPDEIVRPVARPRIEELRRARVRCLGVTLARQPVCEQVGDEQQCRRAVQPAVRVDRKQLEQRVDRQELDAGRRVDLLRGNARERVAHEVCAASVPVRERIGEQRTVSVEEPEIDAPCVDAHAADALSRRPHVHEC